LTDTYRPGGRAINYRSEPFGINNMHLQHEYFGFEDESMGYSSYTFGDPSPTIPVPTLAIRPSSVWCTVVRKSFIRIIHTVALSGGRVARGRSTT